MDLSHIKAIVFDLEGTLLDRVKSREKFIEEQFERFHDYFVHVQLADFKNKFIELDDDEDNDKPELYKQIIKQFHIDRLTWKDLFHDFEMHFTVMSFLIMIRYIPWKSYRAMIIRLALSLTEIQNCQFRLHSLGIMHVINYLTTSETVGYRKPHPKIFEDMIEQLDVEPSEIMYVGDDALNDVAPARAMGMVSVWYKQEDAELEPLEEEVDFTITTIEELLTILPENFEPEGEERNGNGFIY